MTLEEFDLESFLEDSYEPQFPDPLEMLAICCLIPFAALGRVIRWLSDHSGEVIISLAVLGELVGALAILSSLMSGGYQ